MSQSAPSWLGGRQAPGAGCRQDVQRSSIRHRTLLQILRNTSSASPSSAVFSSSFEVNKPWKIVQTLTVTRDQCRQTIQHCGQQVTSAPGKPQESSVATQTGIQSWVGHLKLALVLQNASEWSHRCYMTQDCCHVLQDDVRKREWTSCWSTNQLTNQKNFEL